jgi:ribokinase
MVVSVKVLNFGALNFDYVYSVSHMVKAGETISSNNLEIFCGGKGLNQSIALARAGVKVYHAGMVGIDGEKLLSICDENGVDRQNITIENVKSGHAIIQVSDIGDNSIILYGGANDCNTKKHVDKVLETMEPGDYILLQNEINLIDYIIDKAYEKELKIILNPSPFNDKLKRCDLSKIGLFLMNETEGQQITGKHEPEEILMEMRRIYPIAEVVLTLGKEGCMYLGKEGNFSCKSYLVQTVDSTAAGDTFTGYYIASIMKGSSKLEALNKASLAASIAVTKKGAIPSIPTMDMIEKALVNTQKRI